MHRTEANTPKRPGRGLRGPAAGNDRFDAESARQILERAAAEQQRLKNEFADSYSFEELQDMAAEAGISSEVLCAAVEAHESNPGSAATGTSRRTDGRARSRRSALQMMMPGHWSRAVKAVVLTTAGGVLFAALALAFPAVAEMVLWAVLLLLVLLSLLVLLGAAPF